MKILSLIFGLLLLPSVSWGIGGQGATCNPSTPTWGSCTLETVPWGASVTNTVNINAGNYTTPYQATQASTRYVLQGNMTADGTAIEVKANYVIIDLNGYTITYNQVSPGEGVVPGAYNLNHIGVRNGSIVQGTAMSEGDQYGLGNNPIGKYNTILGGSRSVAYFYVGNVYVRYGGRDVGGINTSGDNGVYEQNTIEDTYEFGTLKNRHQGIDALCGAKNVTTTGNVYRNNTIVNARQRGIAPGNNAKIYGNKIGIRSIATNAYGVYQYGGQNLDIYSNTINGRGEHPLGIGAGGGAGSDNYNIYDNYINLQTTALGEEYAGSYPGNPTATYISNSASGIIARWGADKINAYSNVIEIVTSSRYTGTYSPTGATAYINGGGKGLFVGAYAGEESYYQNNTISVTGDASYNYGVACSNNYSDGLYILNNTVTSSQYNMVVGDDYGPCNDYPLFQNNVFIKNGARSDYKTIISTYNDNGRNSTGRFVDNTYQGGAAESIITLQPNSGGITDIYFGTYTQANGYLYSTQKHDSNNTSTVLVTTTHDPAITLSYRYPGYIIPTPICDATHLALCTVEADCTGASGYWYNGQCNATPAATCSIAPSLCVTEGTCTTAGYNWCSGVCQSAACVAPPPATGGKYKIRGAEAE